MIGTEKVHPDAKFVDLFARVTKLERALIEALEKLDEVHAILNVNPETNSRKPLSLKSGTR